jgi:hypothetical protein
MRSDRTSSFLNEANQRVIRKTACVTSSSYSRVNPYDAVLPSNINVFSALPEKISGLENPAVTEQVKQILLYLYLSLQRAYEFRQPENYLSRMNLVQQEDKAALLEWSFQDFRVGFTLEPEKDESSFFVVSQDKNAGSFTMNTQKLDTDISLSVKKIVEYVLENT